MMTKEKYQALAVQTPDLPLFMQPFWLDAVAKTWSVCGLTDTRGHLLAALVFENKQKWGFTRLMNPVLTPACGIWYAPQVFKSTYAANTFYKKIQVDLLAQIPKATAIDWRFFPETTDWQPFYWAGFEQTTRYTYRLDLQLAVQPRFFSENIQRNIKKGQRLYRFIEWSQAVSLFESPFSAVARQLLDSPYQRQGQKNPVSWAVWQRLEAVLAIRHQRFVLLAQDTEGVQALAYFVVDGSTTYYLAGGSTDKGRQTGALAALLALGIEKAAHWGCQTFDFEGSMLPGVEMFFRGFNAVQTPYFALKKRSRWWSIWEAFHKRR